MAKLKKSEQKLLELQRTGTLNPSAAAISDALFREHPFFDPRDLLQVRYEMLRRHRVEGLSIVEVAAAFAVSRPTFYQAQTAFERAGLTGLMPRQRGPREGHKLSGEVIEHVRNLKLASPGLTTSECVKAIKEKFGITVHRRSLERALRDKKKLRKKNDTSATS
jgi:transposase